MSRRSLLVAMVALQFIVAGCSTVTDAGDSVAGWFKGDSTLITLEKNSTEARPESAPKYAATLRFSNYVDQRSHGNPRLLGMSTQLIRGVSGDKLLIDQDIANLVTASIKQRFAAEGYQVLEGDAAAAAMFEVSGVVKDLALNIKNRDEINIVIETTLKDAHSGAVLWSGMVTEKNDRFAGVSGNSKDDVVSYLRKGLRVVSNKTVETVSASLMAARPELFNLAAGTRAVPGVSAYVAPTSAPLASTGLLVVDTIPPRAKVYLDGVYFGMSPLRVEKEPGVYTVVVKLKAYKTATEKVSVRKGDKTEMELTLEH